MSKVTLTDLSNLQNENTAVNAINSNNATLETAFDNTLSRNGAQPNQMNAGLDMNSRQILNLPPPGDIFQPIRLKDFNDYLATLPTVINTVRAGSILDYGASIGASAAVNTTAINAALAANNYVYVPSGTYAINTINIVHGNTALVGDGPGLSIFTSANTNTAMIGVDPLLGNIRIENLGLTRSVIATSGGTGLLFRGYVDTSCVRNLEVQKSYIGMSLSATGYSALENCYIHNNISDGVFMTNTSTIGTIQWYLLDNLCESNGGRGYIVVTASGPSGATLGDWTGCRSFDNGSFGVAFVGQVGTPLNGVRTRSCFFGEDGNSEIFMDTYGGLHLIQNCFFELSPSMGIEITANNIDVLISGCTIDGNSSFGLNTQATEITTIQNCVIRNNTNFGVVIADGTKALLNSNYFHNNGAGTTFVSLNGASLSATGNLPSTINTYASMTGGASFYTGTAVPVGGLAGTGIKLSSTSNLGIFFGVLAPTLSAALGSLYIRTDGASTTSRMYINTDGGTTWTPVVTVI